MKRVFLFVTVLLILMYAIFEGLSLVGLTVLSRWKQVNYEPAPLALTSVQRTFLEDALEKYERTGTLGKHSPALGWSPVKGGQSHEGLYRWNSQGIAQKSNVHSAGSKCVGRCFHKSCILHIGFTEFLDADKILPPKVVD